jgi:hypothetical protein
MQRVLQCSRRRGELGRCRALYTTTVLIQDTHEASIVTQGARHVGQPSSNAGGSRGCTYIQMGPFTGGTTVIGRSFTTRLRGSLESQTYAE